MKTLRLNRRLNCDLGRGGGEDKNTELTVAAQRGDQEDLERAHRLDQELLALRKPHSFPGVRSRRKEDLEARVQNANKGAAICRAKKFESVGERGWR